jgi:hypothetical protein
LYGWPGSTGRVALATRGFRTIVKVLELSASVREFVFAPLTRPMMNVRERCTYWT